MSIERDTLLNYLASTFGLETAQVNDETLLFSDGLLDSFSVADLLLYLEEQGDFEIEPEEIVPENLDSIGRIIAFARQKSAA